MFAGDTMLQEARGLEAALVSFCDRFDVDSIPGPEVGPVHQHLTRATKLLDGARTRLARRVEDSGAWRKDGDRTCEEFLARTAGTTTGAAKDRLTASKRLVDLPATEAAVRAGALSAEQAAVVADAAAANPAAEERLLATAKLEPMSGLRDEARRAKAAADPDPQATQARIHAGRCLRRWTDNEGAYNLSLRTTAKAGAEIDAALAPVIDRVFSQARTDGRHESPEAYAADALHQLVTTRGTDSKRSRAREAKVIALVSHRALVRGKLEDGETCELAGVGPVPVSTVHDMLDDAFLAAVVTDGVDVFNVAHLGRQATAHQRTALQARGYRCEVPGCPARHNLEIDHVDEWCQTLRTKLDRLAWLCPHHHRLKTTKGHRLEGTVGHRRWLDGHGTLLAADDPDPPPEPGLS
ncbi:MAG TPA: DUF222 domain-containing protein [Acidimicrobiales bacterium]|nr:DUF222 domain-containing protein [Acidimicrobiales bacterium]